MTRRCPDPLFGPAMLALEAQQVIALRMARLAFGGAAAASEAERMVTEKIDATIQAASMVSNAILTGSPDAGAAEVNQMLRRRVRANRKRLLK